MEENLDEDTDNFKEVSTRVYILVAFVMGLIIGAGGIWILSTSLGEEMQQVLLCPRCNKTIGDMTNDAELIMKEWDEIRPQILDQIKVCTNVTDCDLMDFKCMDADGVRMLYNQYYYLSRPQLEELVSRVCT